MAKRTTHRKPGLTETVKTDGGRETCRNPEAALKPPKDYEVAGGEYSFSPRTSSGLTAERVADVFARRAAVVSESRETIAGLRNLIRESVSENTLKAYCRALGRLVVFMGIPSAEEANIRVLLEKLDDRTLGRYVARIEGEGKTPAKAQRAIAAACSAAQSASAASMSSEPPSRGGSSARRTASCSASYRGACSNPTTFTAGIRSSINA